MNLFRTTQALKIYFILYFSLNIMIVVTLEKGRSNRYQKIKSEQWLNKPVYTFVKTDKHANIKWGVRHYVPRALRRADFNN